MVKDDQMSTCTILEFIKHQYRTTKGEPLFESIYAPYQGQMEFIILAKNYPQAKKLIGQQFLNSLGNMVTKQMLPIIFKEPSKIVPNTSLSRSNFLLSRLVQATKKTPLDTDITESPYHRPRQRARMISKASVFLNTTEASSLHSTEAITNPQTAPSEESSQDKIPKTDHTHKPPATAVSSALDQLTTLMDTLSSRVDKKLEDIERLAQTIEQTGPHSLIHRINQVEQQLNTTSDQLTQIDSKINEVVQSAVESKFSTYESTLEKMLQDKLKTTVEDIDRKNALRTVAWRTEQKAFMEKMEEQNVNQKSQFEQIISLLQVKDVKRRSSTYHEVLTPVDNTTTRSSSRQRLAKRMDDGSRSMQVENDE
jgi:hypothetical protein